MDGVEIPFHITEGGGTLTQPRTRAQLLQTDSTLAQSQRALLTMFQKPIGSTWATVVIDNVEHCEPESKPFLELQEGMAIRICFQRARAWLRVRLLMHEQTIQLTVHRRAYLSEVRAFLNSEQRMQWTWENRPVLICPHRNAVFENCHDLLH